jgi:hypothetical protein
VSQLCKSALKYMKSIRRDLPCSMEEAMTMPHILQVFPPPLLVFVLPRARAVPLTTLPRRSLRGRIKNLKRRTLSDTRSRA